MDVQGQELTQENSKTQLRVNPLMKVLAELCYFYEDLYKILQSEKKFLIGADITNLTENNRLKEALLYKIRALDRHREKVEDGRAHV